ncbi:MAG TPA: protein-methionine-sulfoxide reductase heme-binding subunit MsrQ [Anaerolineales bacterium]|nr:protein-methionine-sulfoxide reductase heme-binding subunit MsrQ [Anaerolineales bacterium]
MKNFFKRYTPLQIIMHIGGWYPITRLLIEFFAGTLSANPIQEMEQRMGRAAITFLVLSLACTPLNTIFHWREAIKRRRALGLYAFMYATIHVTIFVDLDYGFAWSLLVQTIFQKPYMIVGLTSFLLLTPLAITSFDVWKMRLGKGWKNLHKLVYFIAPLAVLHYAWAQKGDLFFLRGNIGRPLLYAVIVILLLIFRISFVRKLLVSLRERILSPFRRRDSHPHPEPNTYQA